MSSAPCNITQQPTTVQTTAGDAVARLTVKETAEYVRLAKGTLDQMRSTGRGPRYSKLGRKIIYDTRDLDQWIEDHKQISTADRPEFRLNRRRRRAAVRNKKI
jgi:predicted DNA-binding transcriptional regulator AlpA